MVETPFSAKEIIEIDSIYSPINFLADTYEFSQCYLLIMYEVSICNNDWPIDLNYLFNNNDDNLIDASPVVCE